MQVTKNYKLGGFFGNSQDKFSDMEEAGQGINTAFKGMGPFAGKGSALRREKRYLKKLEREGRLNDYGPQSADRLDYLRNVQKDRAKKGIAAGALAAGAAFGAPALASAIQAKGGMGALLSGLGKKGMFKGATKAVGNIQKAREIFGSGEQASDLMAMSPEDAAQALRYGFYDDPSMNPFMMGGKMKLLKGNDGKMTAEDLKMLRAMLEARLPR